MAFNHAGCRMFLLMAGMLPLPASAGCGAAVCSINTDWDAQGIRAEPGARVDLRYEFIDQDQLMAGNSRVSSDHTHRHHDETRTINRNWIATFDYAFSDKVGVSVSLPIVDRSHAHIHNHHGEEIPEKWNFSEIGDARVLGRLHFTESADSGIGALFGLKLPSGDFEVQNEEGARAERTLQPGTGTTDVLAGGYYRSHGSETGAWFAQILWQAAVGEREDFRPGDRVGVDLGYRHALTGTVNALLQVNLLHRGRDSGAQAEPDDSGGHFAFIGPGLSYQIGRATQIHGFVQVPVYQYVNGVQLTATWSLVAGLATRF